MPANQWIKRLVSEGFIGDPRHLNLRYFTGFARHADYSWRFDPDISGSGVIGDLGSHWLHLARWWFGEVTEIGAFATTFSERPPREDGTRYRTAEDSALITVRFASGAYGSLQVSAVCWEGTPFGQTHHADLHGTDGTLYSLIDWDTVQEVRGLKADQAGPAPVLPIPEEMWPSERRSVVGDTYRDVFRRTDVMARQWLRQAAAGEMCAPDLREGARVQDLLDAAVVSAAGDGRMVPVPVRAPA
jgi:predicted dehydrogenase